MWTLMLILTNLVRNINENKILYYSSTDNEPGLNFLYSAHLYCKKHHFLLCTYILYA